VTPAGQSAGGYQVQDFLGQKRLDD